MAFGLLGGRLLLAAIFVAAAAGKLRARIGFRRTLVAFGVPGAAVDSVAILIPPVELAVAILLLPAASARAGAAASLVLLAAFTAATAVNLAQGRTPECACFGTTASEPIGPATLARNVALSVCALLIVVAGPGARLGAVATEWGAASADERFLSVTSLALLVALMTMNWYAAQLRSANVRLSAGLESLERQLETARAPSAGGSVGLPRGTLAPPFDLPRLEGDRASLDTLKEVGLPLLLIFSDAHCSACAQLWPDISRWEQQCAGTLTVAVICGGPPPLVEMKLVGTSVTNVLLAGEAKLTDLYSLSLIPSAVIVGSDGRIDSEGAVGIPAIRSLVAQRTRLTGEA